MIEHFSQEGAAFYPGQEPRLGEGVRGVAFDLGTRGIWLSLIIADRPGTGEVGRWLDALPRNRRLVVPNVISSKLAGMLERRGFVRAREYDPEWDEEIPIHERPGEAAHG